MSIANVFFSIGLVFLLREVSERSWITGALIYVPQTPLLIPSVCLLACSLIWHMRSSLLNLAAGGLILFALCGFRFSMKPLVPLEASTQHVRVLSCNVQNFQPNFGKVLREIARNKPHVIAFQEAFDPPDMLKEYLEDWNWIHDGEFLVGSAWPLRPAGTFEATPYERPTVMKVEVDSPHGLFLLSDLHLMTARRGLTDLSVESILSGDGPASVDHHAFLRDSEAMQTRTFISESDRDTPHLVVGDFNMPTNSSIFAEHYGDLTNSFDDAGIGFGYTAPCRPVRFWLPRVPWLRIDHVLTSRHWRHLLCETGEFNGSDHRLVVATLQMQSPNASPP